MKTTSKIDQQIGLQLRNKRVERQLSVQHLASLINVTFDQLAAFESGDARIDNQSMLLLCKLFDVRPTYFFERLHQKTTDDAVDALSHSIHTLMRRVA